MTDRGELEEILDDHLYQFDGSVMGIPEAAKAIAARLTPVAGLDEIQQMINAGYKVSISKLGDGGAFAEAVAYTGQIVSFATGSTLSSALAETCAGTPGVSVDKPEEAT